jgi:type I restriction enzyme S subunit
MVLTSVKIADCVQSVETWNPLKAGSDDEFVYVDLSAVDQDLKTVAGSKTLACHDAPSRARQLVRADDVLVSTVRPNLNGVALVDVAHDGATASTGFCVLRADPGKLDPRYLFQWVKSSIFVDNMVRKATGASYPAVSDRIIFDSRLPLPSLSEQRRIAAILDQADTLRAKRREALAQLDHLAQSIFVEMFGDPATNPKGWPVSRIRDLLESASYGTSERSDTSGKFPVLRMNNITRTGEMDFTDLKYMDLDDSEYERYLVKTGDVLFNRTNSAELVGKTAIFREAESMAYAGYLVRLRTNADNNAEYLAAFMNTPYTKRVLRGMCKSIIGMANINATEVQGIKIAQPPLALQVQFQQRIDSLNRVKASHRAMLIELDKLFSSLQHRAFQGEL